MKLPTSSDRVDMLCGSARIVVCSQATLIPSGISEDKEVF